MNLLRYPLRVVDGVVDRICAVAGAILFSQFPAFLLHYVQRLSGHVEEAKANLAGWQSMADKIGGGSIQKMLLTPPGDAGTFGAEAARKCAADLARFEHLQDSLSAIQQSPIWRRGFAFIRHMDVDIVRATARDYVPNVPLDVESLAYAAAGLVVAVIAYQVVKHLAVVSSRKIRKRTKPAEPPRENQAA